METNVQYSKKEYWDNRYVDEESFEWLSSFGSFEKLITPLLNAENKILHVGCGNSGLSFDLFSRGFTNITNLDYSEVLINDRKIRFPEQKWICDDMCTMKTIASNSFDVVIEKATIEALLVGEKSPWSPSDEALHVVDNVFESVLRVLTEDGMFISISFTQPHFRVPALLRHRGWSIEVHEYGDSFHFYVYIMRKGQQVDTAIIERFGKLAPDWLR